MMSIHMHIWKRAIHRGDRHQEIKIPTISSYVLAPGVMTQGVRIPSECCARATPFWHMYNTGGRNMIASSISLGEQSRGNSIEMLGETIHWHAHQTTNWPAVYTCYYNSTAFEDQEDDWAVIGS